jgi:hypothetical protein
LLLIFALLHDFWYVVLCNFFHCNSFPRDCTVLCSTS